MFFKVTTADLYSLYGSYFPKFRVQYSTEHFVKSKAGGLFCYNFECLDFSQGPATFPEYPTDSDTRRLWICECINPVFPSDIFGWEVSHLSYVQENLEIGILPKPSNTPYGVKAVLADEIKLVREIDFNELQELYAEYKKGR